MKDYICNGNKYVYSKGYIYLPIDISELPKEVEIDGDKYSFAELEEKSTEIDIPAEIKSALI